MKNKYYAYWSTGSSYNCPGYVYTNLRTAIKDIRVIGRGNDTGSGCRVWIDDIDGETVYSAKIKERKK